MSSKRAGHVLAVKIASAVMHGKTRKSSSKLEKIMKGVANHWRIEILLLVARRKGITVDELAQSIECGFKVISVHSHKLVQAGLLEKKYQNRNVMHFLTPLGRTLVSFLSSL